MHAPCLPAAGKLQLRGPEERILSADMETGAPYWHVGRKPRWGQAHRAAAPSSVALGGGLPAQPLLPQSRVGTPFGLSITLPPHAAGRGAPTSERASCLTPSSPSRPWPWTPCLWSSSCPTRSSPRRALSSRRHPSLSPRRPRRQPPSSSRPHSPRRCLSASPRAAP